MKRVFKHLRIFIFRGILAVIPLALTFFAVQFLYFTVDRRVAELVEAPWDLRFRVSACSWP